MTRDSCRVQLHVRAPCWSQAWECRRIELRVMRRLLAMSTHRAEEQWTQPTASGAGRSRSCKQGFYLRFERTLVKAPTQQGARGGQVGSTYANVVLSNIVGVLDVSFSGAASSKESVSLLVLAHHILLALPELAFEQQRGSHSVAVLYRIIRDCPNLTT